MHKLTRLAIIGGAAALALTLSAPALAAFTPSLDVSVPNKPGASGKVKVHLAVGPTDDATARVVVFSPIRFTANGGTAGATIGTVQARVVARDLGGAIVPVPGMIEVRTASATYLSSGVQVPLASAAMAYTGTTTHTAYWVFRLTVSGNAIELPAFFDLTEGAQRALGTSKVTFCGQPDDLPPGTPGRAPFGIKLVDAVLTLNAGVWRNPTTAGPYLWTSLWTPFNPRVGTPNVVGTVSAVSLTVVGVALTLRGKFNKPRKSATLTGRISVSGRFRAGVRLPLFAGPRAKALRRSGSTNATRAIGAFTAVKRMPRTTSYQVRFTSPAVQMPALCALLPSTFPRCVTSSVGGISVLSNIVKVRFRR
jgi:hypothetical protein